MRRKNFASDLCQEQILYQRLLSGSLCTEGGFACLVQRFIMRDMKKD